MLRGGGDSLKIRMFECLELNRRITSNCLGSFNSNYQISISYFLEDIDPIFNATFPCQVFGERLIPYYQITVAWVWIDNI